MSVTLEGKVTAANEFSAGAGPRSSMFRRARPAGDPPSLACMCPTRLPGSGLRSTIRKDGHSGSPSSRRGAAGGRDQPKAATINRVRDYQALECEFITGGMSLRELCRAHGITAHSAVVVQARQGGWAGKRRTYRARASATYIEHRADRAAIREAEGAVRAREPHNNRCLRRSAGRAQDPAAYAARAPAAPKAHALPLRYTPTVRAHEADMLPERRPEA